MKIEVTDLATGVSSEYDYSKDNWAKRWACMRGGRVHMWAPKEVSEGMYVITSGCKWMLKKG